VDAQRIDELKRELDDFDRAMLTTYAVNKPSELDVRRKELRARLRGAAGAPAAPTFTKQEMRDAAARLMSTVLKSRTIQ
jgi:hypothetical protein